MSPEDVLIIFISFALKLLVEFSMGVLACIGEFDSRQIIFTLRIGGLAEKRASLRDETEGKREV